MTRPEEPVDDRALPPPVDPWATINRPAATVYFGDPDTTVTMAPAGRTGYPPRPNPPIAPTVRQDTPAPTVRAHQELRFEIGRAHV